jgi:Ca-activated chloride channel family protein
MRRRRYGDKPAVAPIGPFDPYGNSEKPVPEKVPDPAHPEDDPHSNVFPQSPIEDQAVHHLMAEIPALPPPTAYAHIAEEPIPAPPIVTPIPMMEHSPMSLSRAPDVDAGPALSLTLRVGNKYAYAAERTRQHVFTQITALGNAISTGQRMPVNIALVVDRSGSMEGEPLEYVKRACNLVVDMLTPQDVLSIVTFETQVEVLMPARHVTDPFLIKQHIGRIAPGNTTNLFDGLYAGGAQVGSVPLEGYVTRVLLLTDGEPTAGLKDFQSIVRLVADLKARGITTTALGFGPEYNEELMAGIARRAGGNYYYIVRPEDIPTVFETEIKQVLGVTAKNVRLQLQLPRGATVRQVYGSPPNFGPRTAEIVLGDLEKGATITKLWEMDWEPRRSGTFRVAKAVVLYEDAVQGRTETISGNAVVEFVNDPAIMPSGVDSSVAQELAVVMASRDLEKTMMGMRTQQFSTADVARAIEKTQTFLAAQGRTEAAHDLEQAAQALHRGDDANIEKTLIGTIYQLDQGKRH